jgi:hypothetical protein
MHIWEVSLADFLLVSVFLGGGAALMTGRATARSWQSWGTLVVYVVLLTFATRFIHFSLFEGSFFLPFRNLPTALYYSLVDFVILMVAAALGRMPTRAHQMRTQYRAVD